MYTSYFAKTRKLRDYNLVSISNSFPTGLRLKSENLLAPNWDLVDAYKKGKISESDYTKEYLEQLKNINLAEILSKYPENTVFLCWEKSDKFCHRHIFSQYAKELGFNINEIKI